MAASIPGYERVDRLLRFAGAMNDESFAESLSIGFHPTPGVSDLSDRQHVVVTND